MDVQDFINSHKLYGHYLYTYYIIVSQFKNIFYMYIFV